VVNTCGVKKQTEDRVIDYIRMLNRKYEGKKIIVSGCLPLINRERLVSKVRFDYMLGPSPGHKLVGAISQVLNKGDGKLVEGDIYTLDSSMYLSHVYKDKKIVTAPIGVSSGCLDKCSFCGTRLARGLVKSIPLESIERMIRLYIRGGIKEIHLTSTDMGAYGYDLRPRRSFIDILRMIMGIEGDFIVRIGMMNPRWAYKWLDELIEIFNSTKRFYYFLHIPVQSGSDKVLGIMRRGHGVAEYLEVVDRLRKEVDPLFSISTDIIVGHPGEDDSDFELTLEVIKESEPDFVNISKFFPRPNTPSKYMKQVPTDVIKMRSIELSELVDSVLLNRNRRWIGWRGEVLVNERGKNNTYMARNYAYKIVVLDGSFELGDVVSVEVIGANVTWLKAIIT
jgi:MiaB-like tRNA modifying enzyme